MANFQNHYDVLPNGSYLYYSDTIPSALGGGITGRVGDYCMVASFTTSGSDCMWVCSTAGTPGTWQVCARGVEEWVLGPFGASAIDASFPLSGGSWQLISVRATATAAGGASGTVTVEWLTGTTAGGSGTAQLTAALAIGSTYTPNTVLNGTLISSPSIMIGGTDRLGLVFAGTLTGLAGLYLTITARKLS